MTTRRKPKRLRRLLPRVHLRSGKRRDRRLERTVGDEKRCRAHPACCEHCQSNAQGNDKHFARFGKAASLHCLHGFKNSQRVSGSRFRRKSFCPSVAGNHLLTQRQSDNSSPRVRKPAVRFSKRTRETWAEPSRIRKNRFRCFCARAEL